MHLYDEFTVLRRMGVTAADYLILPRVFGLALALPTVTVFFQVVAVGSGWLAVALLQNQPLLQVSGNFMNLADPWLVLLSLAASGALRLDVAVDEKHLALLRTGLPARAVPARKPQTEPVQAGIKRLAFKAPAEQT